MRAVRAVMAIDYRDRKKKLSCACESIISSLVLVTKSGVFNLGIVQTVKFLCSGMAKLVIFANDFAPTHKSLFMLKYFAMLVNVKSSHSQQQRWFHRLWNYNLRSRAHQCR
jgi:ribosomal protein L30E